MGSTLAQIQSFHIFPSKKEIHLEVHILFFFKFLKNQTRTILYEKSLIFILIGFPIIECKEPFILLSAFKDAIAKAKVILRSLGDQSGVPIETKPLLDACNIAESLPLCSDKLQTCKFCSGECPCHHFSDQKQVSAKLSGAGGGDCIIAAGCRRCVNWQLLDEKWEENGFTPLDFDVI